MQQARIPTPTTWLLSPVYTLGARAAERGQSRQPNAQTRVQPLVQTVRGLLAATHWGEPRPRPTTGRGRERLTPPRGGRAGRGQTWECAGYVLCCAPDRQGRRAVQSPVLGNKSLRGERPGAVRIRARAPSVGRGAQGRLCGPVVQTYHPRISDGVLGRSDAQITHAGLTHGPSLALVCARGTSTRRGCLAGWAHRAGRRSGVPMTSGAVQIGWTQPAQPTRAEIGVTPHRGGDWGAFGLSEHAVLHGIGRGHMPGRGWYRRGEQAGSMGAGGGEYTARGGGGGKYSV